LVFQISGVNVHEGFKSGHLFKLDLAPKPRGVEGDQFGLENLDGR
jgi:hypothetical protein